MPIYPFSSKQLSSPIFRKNSLLDLSIEWNGSSQLDKDLPILKRIFLASFEDAYRSFTPEGLGLKEGQTKEERLNEVFNEESKKIQNHEMQYLISYINDSPVGIATFKPDDKTANLYLSILGILPAAERIGIGKNMLMAIQNRYYQLNGIELDTRAINLNAISFYESLGFIKKAPGEINSEYNSQPSVVGMIRSNIKNTKQSGFISRTHSALSLSEYPSTLFHKSYNAAPSLTTDRSSKTPLQHLPSSSSNSASSSSSSSSKYSSK